MLGYLENKRNLTVGVNNAAVDVDNAEHARAAMKSKYKAVYIGMVVVLLIMAVAAPYEPLFVETLVCLWEFAIPVIIVLRNISGHKTKKAIRDARNNLNAEYNRSEYVGGQEGFPSKFYSYTAISRLMNLIQENRAASFQEAYNLLEIQGIQEEQLRMARQSAEYQRQQAEYSKKAFQQADYAARKADSIAMTLTSSSSEGIEVSDCAWKHVELRSKTPADSRPTLITVETTDKSQIWSS